MEDFLLEEGVVEEEGGGGGGLDFTELLLEQLRQLVGRHVEVAVRPVVLQTVVPHEADVCSEAHGILIPARLQLPLNGPQVHGVLDDLRVVGQSIGLPVHGLQEGLRVLAGLEEAKDFITLLEGVGEGGD